MIKKLTVIFSFLKRERDFASIFDNFPERLTFLIVSKRFMTVSDLKKVANVLKRSRHFIDETFRNGQKRRSRNAVTLFNE
jgi:hypothetical protein